jgi:hypothetical protein
MTELLDKSEYRDVEMEADQQGIKMEAKQQVVKTEVDQRNDKLEAEHKAGEVRAEQQAAEMGEVTTAPKEPFPFMRLPPEIRNMVYKELLVQPGVVCVQYNDLLMQKYVRKRFRMEEYVRSKDGLGIDVCIDGRSIRQLLWTSKTIYREASTFYFGSNHFRFECLGTFTTCLQHLKPDFRRLLRRITVPFTNDTPARAMKLLGTCISLSELTLEISSLSTTWSSRRHQGRMKFNGLNDLLKIRGLDKLTVDSTRLEPFRRKGIDVFADEKGLANVLQILKEPHDPAKLKRQEAKDYPDRKSQRIVFGKANVKTRTKAGSEARRRIHNSNGSAW